MYASAYLLNSVFGDFNNIRIMTELTATIAAVALKGTKP